MKNRKIERNNLTSFFSFLSGKFLANSKARQTKPRGMIFIKDFFFFNNAKNN